MKFFLALLVGLFPTIAHADPIITPIAAWLTSIGLSATTATFIATTFVYATALTLLNTAIKALSPRPKGGRGYGLEYNYAGTAEPRRLIYGKQRVGGMQTIPPIVTGYDGSLLHMVVTLCGHKVHDITDMGLDQNVIVDANIGPITSNSDSGKVTAGDFANHVWFRRYDGTQTTVDWILNDQWPAGFDSRFVGHEITYVAVQLKWNANIFGSGIPNITALVYGKKIYDPRLDSTNGGSGTHRYTDENTWEYSVNPALIARDFLVNEVGFGNDEIDDTLVAAAANICDQQVEIPPGSVFENRYECNITLFAVEDWEENLKSIVDTMFGRAYYRDGKWRIFAGAWDTPSSGLTITKDDWVSPTVVKTSVDREDRWNAVRANYVDPDRNWQYAEAFPRRNTTYESDDGGERIWREIELPGVISEYQAQRIAELFLRMSRNQMRITGSLRPEFIQLTPWDTVPISDDEYGWTSKTFRVLSMNMASDGTVEAAFVEDGSALYTDMAVADYQEVTTTPTPDPGATLPAVAGTLLATPERGYINFQWSTTSAEIRGQTYRLLESVNCYDPNVASEVWKGIATNAILPRTDVTTRFYWVQGQIGSYFSGYSPSSWGLGAAPNSPPADGTPGSYAPNLSLVLDGYAFRFSGSGTVIGVNTINVDGVFTGVSGVTAEFYAQNYMANGAALNSYQLSGSGNENRGLHVSSFTQGGSTAYAYVVASGSNLSDKQTVVRLEDGTRGSSGTPGAGAFNWINPNSNWFVTQPNAISVNSMGAGWQGGPYAAEGYEGGAFVTAVSSSISNKFIGLSSSPSYVDSVYYGWMLYTRVASSNIGVYHDGQLPFNSGSVDLGTVRLGVFYEGSQVRYTVNNSTIYTRPTSEGQTRYLDTAFNGQPHYFNEVAFGPMGRGAVDNITGLLTNDNHTLASSYNGYIPSYDGASGKMVLFEGINSVSVNSITFASSAVSPVGMTVTNSVNGAYAVTGGIGVSDEYGIANIAGTYKSVTVDKTFTISKAKGGASGLPGGLGPGGGNLVLNGDFSALNTYVGRVAGWDGAATSHYYYIGSGPSGGNVMANTVQNASIFNQGIIAVNPRTDNLTVRVVARSVSSGSRIYFGIDCLDAQKRSLRRSFQRAAGLLQLWTGANSGDTTIDVGKPTHYSKRHTGYNATITYNLIEVGEMLPEFDSSPGKANAFSLYPRYAHRGHHNRNCTAINTTLSSSYDRLTLNAGLPLNVDSGRLVLHGIAGGNYEYMDGGHVPVSSAWTTIEWDIRGLHAPYAAASAQEVNKFRQGTEFARFLILSNYAGVGGTDSENQFAQVSIVKRQRMGELLVADPDMTFGAGMWEFYSEQNSTTATQFYYAPNSGITGGALFISNAASSDTFGVYQWDDSY